MDVKGVINELTSKVYLHPVAHSYVVSPARTRAIFKGNQGGGTTVAAYDAALRLLGLHPVEYRNKLDKPIRFVSKVKPKDSGDEENQQYVEFKRLFPAELIKSDVTVRVNNMKLRDPAGGADHVVEFMSSQQEIDAFMSVQRSALYQDEEIDRLKWDENKMRLAKASSDGTGGDTSICLTPVRGLDWTYDDIWLKAECIYRSKLISEKFGFPEVEETGKSTGIVAFCWATDDNPVMKKEALDNLFSGIDDPDELAMRRYGVFRQVSGRIYKNFERQVIVLPEDARIDFSSMWNYRVIDYHPNKPWNVSWVAVSDRNEWFVFQEYLANSDRYTTNEIRDHIRAMSVVDEDDLFNRASLIDPLSKMMQSNSGMSAFDSLRLGEEGLRRLQGADTKNTNGRMSIKTRINNSLRCGMPFNNMHPDGVVDMRYGPYLPTIWFTSDCPGHIEHFSNWRYIDWQHERVKANKTTKREGEKWSDYCRNLEFLGALNPVYYEQDEADDYTENRYFRGRR